ncbi:hypothetical protein [Clostridium saudiense]|uniref:hypothetical protein n=1 Tax=Clostridium saudiense TaxID=1414720 RepID=UPI0018AC0FA6|nr:hypothetical protein [Clostridium saudiense]
MEIKKEFHNYLSKKDLNLLYCIFVNSVEVYKDIVEKNSQDFSGAYFDSFKGKLLGYIVKKAFDPKLLPSNFPFRINISKMNFNQRRAELRKGNIILTIAKESGKHKLPSYSNYKRDYSKGNSEIITQLYFDFFDDSKIKNLPYYGVIVYEVEENELKDLNIIIPNDNFTSVLDVIPIKYDENIDMTIETISKKKLKECVQSEIENNPNLIKSD